MATFCTTSARPSAPRTRTRRAALAILGAAGIALSTVPAQVATAQTAAASTGGGPGGGTTTLTSTVAAPTGAAQVAVDTALAQLGDPYVWAGAGPDVFDCSGLTQYAFAAAGIGLPHSSAMQSTMGSYVPREALQPGDLVFFYSPVGHVGMYIGDGLMVHAPQPGETVEIIPVDAVWGYNTARRMA
jgi:cell wall-associated NlpC family hydrolase